jgi:D-mannonate dehydratase
MDADEPTVKVTGLISPLKDKLHSQKKKIQAILSKPKSERNRDRLKTLLKESKNLRKVLKAFSKQGVEVCCPNCNHVFKVQNQ